MINLRERDFFGAGNRTGLGPAGSGGRKQRPALGECPTRDGGRKLAEETGSTAESAFGKNERQPGNFGEVLWEGERVSG